MWFANWSSQKLFGVHRGCLELHPGAVWISKLFGSLKKCLELTGSAKRDTCRLKHRFCHHCGVSMLSRQPKAKTFGSFIYRHLSMSFGHTWRLLTSMQGWLQASSKMSFAFSRTDAFQRNHHLSCSSPRLSLSTQPSDINFRKHTLSRSRARVDVSGRAPL